MEMFAIIINCYFPSSQPASPVPVHSNVRVLMDVTPDPACRHGRSAGLDGEPWDPEPAPQIPKVHRTLPRAWPWDRSAAC